MYRVNQHSILPEIPEKDGYIFTLPKEILSKERTLHDMNTFWQEQYDESQCTSFDEWRNLLSREQELKHCIELIEQAKKERKHIHIANISSREIIEYISDYYLEEGYFSDYPRKCEVPKESIVTTSISIASLCYSEKQKNTNLYETIEAFPPIRSSSDQKYFTTMIRTGVIVYIEIPNKGGKKCLKELLKGEIISPFLLGKITNYNIVKYGMTLEEVYEEIIQLD